MRSSLQVMQHRVDAVILAAGMSRRMGRPKPLLDFGGRPLIGRIIEALCAVEQINPVVVVTGHEALAGRIREILESSKKSPFPPGDDMNHRKAENRG